MATGDDDEAVASRNRRVQANLGLVLRVARHYVHRGLTLEDLVAEGNLGLIRAAELFCPDYGTRFSTYAVFYIRDAIQSALANTANTIRVPVNVARLLGRWRRTERALWHVNGHRPTFEEVATAMGLDAPTQRLVDKAHCVARVRKQGPDTRMGGWLEMLTLDESATHVDSLAEAEERQSISRRLERLERRERLVIMLRYGLGGEPPLSMEQIRMRLGITKAAVEKLVSLAIRKLGRRGQACA